MTRREEKTEERARLMKHTHKNRAEVKKKRKHKRPATTEKQNREIHDRVTVEANTLEEQQRKLGWQNVGQASCV